MDNNKKFFIGIDVSKPYFDASVLAVINHQKQPIATERFENSPAGIKTYQKWLKLHRVSMDADTLTVIENTGIYHRLLWSFYSSVDMPLNIGNAAHIKWSFGIARGKNDVIDSQRLCQYAQKHADELKATPPLNKVLLLLKDLMTSRNKLLSQVNSIKTYIKELRGINDKATQALLEQAHKTAIEGITKSIKLVEGEILKIIKGNKDIETNYGLLKTVPGIGHLTAVYLICCTNNFTCRITGKQLACYAGVVPFEHTSGISVKGRSRVHQMANKELKKMLHLCAISTIQYHDEFKAYYERKKKY